MKATLLFSGGIDSAVALYGLRKIDRFDVAAVFVRYGQRHARREEKAAEDLARLAGAEFVVIDITKPMQQIGATSALVGFGSDLTGKDVVVGGRNTIFISLAMAHAMAHGSNLVVYGATKSDEILFADCTASYAQAMGQVTAAQGIMLNAPWVNLEKWRVVAHGESLDVPFGLSYSCYEGKAEHCGRCLACRERRRGFAKSEVKDPTIYAAKNGPCPICAESGLVLNEGGVFQPYSACECQAQ